MDWIKKRVWQLGIAVVLSFIAWWLMYTAGTDEPDQTLLWVGLALFFVAMLVPLASKLFQSTQETEGEEGES